MLGGTAGAAAARRLFRSPKAKHRLTWAGEALERHGATIIVVARFVPGGRTATTFTAGTLGLAWPRFAVADAVGTSLWATYAAGLGYLGGETFERRPLYAFLFGLGVALLVALAVEAARPAPPAGYPAWRSGGAWPAAGAMNGAVASPRCRLLLRVAIEYGLSGAHLPCADNPLGTNLGSNSN